MPTLFRSERLIYRAVEDTPEDDAFIHSVESEPMDFAKSTGVLQIPQSKKNTMAGYKKYLQEEALLGVIICIAPPEQPSSSDSAWSKTSIKAVPVGIMNLKEEGLARRHHRRSVIGIGIADGHRGKGYGSEAIEWALWWGFEMANLHRIGIDAFGWNEGAVKLYDKLGFVREGRQREILFYMGGWHDLVQFSMLEHEWREREKLRKAKDGSK